MADDKDIFEKIVDLKNKKHGYGSAFGYNNKEDKQRMELDTASEWCRSMTAEYGCDVGTPKPNENDPPDCIVSVNGKPYGVELVQLVEEGHVARATKENHRHQQLFVDTQWDRQRFLRKINEVSLRKAEKYAKKYIVIDVLLIHCDEPWLLPHQAQEWLLNAAPFEHTNIKNIFLLFPYQPGGTEHWPLFRIYGDLGQ